MTPNEATTPKSAISEPSIPEPSILPNLPTPKFGFSQYAERLNGRAAMFGFASAVAIEYLTGKGALAWLGLIR